MADVQSLGTASGKAKISGKFKIANLKLHHQYVSCGSTKYCESISVRGVPRNMGGKLGSISCAAHICSGHQWGNREKRHTLDLEVYSSGGP